MKASQDINQKRRAAADLERLAEQRQLALDAAHMGWWHYDPATQIATWDERYKEIFGVSGYERPNEEILARLHPEDLPGVWAEVEAALNPADPKPYFTQYRIFACDGSVRWIEAHGIATFEGEGGERCAVSFVGTVQDITDRKRADEELRSSTALLQAISDSTGDVIFAKDREGRLTFANPAVLALIGKPLEQVLGVTDAVFLEDKEAARTVMENDRRVMESGVAEDVEESVPLADGTHRVWLSRKMPYRDADGRIIGLLGVSRDATERVALEEELRRKAGELEAAARAKDEFLAMLSHELRNPLGAITNAGHLVGASGIQDPAVQRAIAVMQRQAHHMSRLVDDLLDVSRITQGVIELRREPVLLSGIVAGAVEAVRPMADEKGHRLTITLANEPLRVLGDPTRLEQVVVNVLHNAVKYTDPGGFIQVVLARDAGNALLHVMDNGAGIPKETLPHVFELFHQAERTPDRSQGGLGIGLTVVKRLVEMHGGAIQAASDGPGFGSEFTLRFPLLPDVPALENASTAHGACAGNALRVLVVDDIVDAADLLSDIVSLWGHSMTAAYDGPEALAKIREERPDVVLLDIGLPRMDGNEVARKVRADPALKNVRLVAVTGYGSEQDKAQTRAAGFDEHLVKPVNLDVLKRVLGQTVPTAGRRLAR